MKKQLLTKLNEGFRKSFTEECSLESIMNYDGNALEDVTISNIFFADEVFFASNVQKTADFYTVFLVFVNSKNESSTVRFSYGRNDIKENLEDNMVDCVVMAPTTYDFQIKEDWGDKYYSVKEETESCSKLDKLLFDFFNEKSIFRNYVQHSLALNESYKEFADFLISQYFELDVLKKDLDKIELAKKLATIKKIIPDVIEITPPCIGQVNAKLKNGYSFRIFLEDFGA